jgi:hypothetical protein
MADMTRITENTRKYNAKLSEVEADRMLSEEGKEEPRKARRKSTPSVPMRFGHRPTRPKQRSWWRSNLRPAARRIRVT